MTTQIKVPIVVNMNMDEIIERLKKDDFVQVVRCKDCYWYGIVELKNDGTENRRYKPSWCFFWNAGMNEVDFCSLAERKEE